MHIFGRNISRGALFLGAVVAVLGLAATRTWAIQNTGTVPNVVVQRPIPQLPAIANSASNSTMIAVTGIDLTGSSILYLNDTERRQIAIYQASGGTDSMQGIKLVGARKIDLDLQLEGYNDKSEYIYEELEKKFADNQRPVAQPKKP